MKSYGGLNSVGGCFSVMTSTRASVSAKQAPRALRAAQDHSDWFEEKQTSQSVSFPPLAEW